MLTLFLDIDGVLNSVPFLRHQRNHAPAQEHRLCDPANLRALERLCREGDIGSIVISSSWRSGRSIEELGQLLAAEGFAMSGRIDGTTEDAPETPTGRAAAIQEYVSKNQLQRFLVLDDLRLAAMPGGVVVHCDPNRGLTDEEVPAILRRCRALAAS